MIRRAPTICSSIVGGAPVVIKLLEGTQGIGVVLGETHKSAKSVIEAFHGANVAILVQEFIKEAEGRDIRAFVVGRTVVAAMERKGAKGDFRSNLHRGGTASMIELTPLEKATALKAARSMGLNVAGVDMLRSSHGPVVMEVNSSPGLEGIEKATGVDVARADHRLRRAQRQARPHAHAGQGMSAFTLGDIDVQPGQRATVDLPVSVLSNHTPCDAAGACGAWREAGTGDVPLGRRPWRRDPGRRDHPPHPHATRRCRRSRGTLLAVPIVNSFGFLNHTRYMPDRRDLNRCFPGSDRGSLASLLADLFLREVVLKMPATASTSTRRRFTARNLPQIRLAPDEPELLAHGGGLRAAGDPDLQAAREARCG